MGLQSMRVRLDRALGGVSRSWILVITLLGVAVVGVPDCLLGEDISLALFYLGPVALTAWYAGRRAGILIAALAAAVAAACIMSAAYLVAHPWIAAWKVLLRLGFMLVVAQLIDSLHSKIQALEVLARTDPHTGLCNRRGFLEHLQCGLDLAAREELTVTLVYVDLDDFKGLNDRQGHRAGDRALRRVAGVLQGAIRRTDVAARLGGDEFALLLMGADTVGARKIVATLRERLAQAFAGDDQPLSCSIGCVTFQRPPADADAAISAADTLMYRVKHRGKDGVAYQILGDDGAAP
jgi:diguanylate cyclase (GGDEF)-like protein